MKRVFGAVTAAVISVSLPIVLATGGTAFAAGGGTPVYESLPSPLPYSVPSLGYEATQTSEFGDEVELAGSGTTSLTSVTVTMDDWAQRSDYPNAPVDVNGDWSLPITLNLYNVDHSTSTPELGSPISTVTQTFAIPFRAEGDVTCPIAAGTEYDWRAPDGMCHTGLAFNITFDLSNAPVTVPDDLVFGIAYDTQDYGSAPYGVAGPYNSLNVGLTSNSTSPTVGTDPNLDDVFWNTSTASNYNDGGASGVGTFREDTNWTPNQFLVEFDTTGVNAALPETPWAIALPVAGFGLLGFAWWFVGRRRRVGSAS